MAAKKKAKAAVKDNGKAWDAEVEKAAFSLRKMGATAAIVVHTLSPKHSEVSYGMAKALVEAADAKQGKPKEVVRVADGLKLAGYTVKDGRKAVAKAAKAKEQAKPAAKAKPLVKQPDKPVAHPVVQA